MSNFEHIILYSFLFIYVFIWGSNNSSKSSTKYWIHALFPIIIISIITGCRFWGADYIWYKYQFEHLEDSAMAELQKSQPAFYLLNRILWLLGFNYVGVYCVYSCIYFIGVFFLLSNYGKYSKYMYLLSLFAYLGFATGIIRQGLSIGILLISIPFLNAKRYILFFACSLLAFLVHSTAIVFVVILIFFKFYFKKIIPVYISIPCYIFITFIFNPGDISIIQKVTSYLSFISPVFAGYTDNSDLWFSEDAIRDVYTQSTYATIFESLFVCSIFYLGYISLKVKSNDKILYIYNYVVVGYIILKMFFNYELLRRIGTPMTMLYPIPLGYSLYVLIKYKRVYFKKKKITKLCSLSIIVYLLLFWGRFLLFNDNSNFFWNS